MGKEFGKMEKVIDEMKKENEGLKDGMAKMMKAFEGIQQENEELKEEFKKLAKENDKKLDFKFIIIGDSSVGK